MTQIHYDVENIQQSAKRFNEIGDAVEFPVESLQTGVVGDNSGAMANEIIQIIIGVGKCVDLCKTLVESTAVFAEQLGTKVVVTDKMIGSGY